MQKKIFNVLIDSRMLVKALLELGLRPVRPSWAQKARPTGIGPVEGDRYKREERERKRYRFVFLRKDVRTLPPLLPLCRFSKKQTVGAKAILFHWINMTKFLFL